MSALYSLTFILGIIFWLSLASASTEEAALTEDSLRPRLEFKTDKLKDPFQDYLASEEQAAKLLAVKAKPAAVSALETKKFVVQGIIWGEVSPYAIINNNVYKEGDTIQDAQITKIEKEGVELLSNGRSYLIIVPAIPDNSEKKK